MTKLCIRDKLLLGIVQERGGTVVEEPVGPQQRLKAILQEDRLDTPEPGSQASFMGEQVAASAVPTVLGV